jgi:hypothetical protein
MVSEYKLLPVFTANQSPRMDAVVPAKWSLPISLNSFSYHEGLVRLV